MIWIDNCTNLVCKRCYWTSDIGGKGLFLTDFKKQDHHWLCIFMVFSRDKVWSREGPMKWYIGIIFLNFQKHNHVFWLLGCECARQKTILINKLLQKSVFWAKFLQPLFVFHKHTHFIALTYHSLQYICTIFSLVY